MYNFNTKFDLVINCIFLVNFSTIVIRASNTLYGIRTPFNNYTWIRFKSWIFSSFTYFSNMLCAVQLRILGLDMAYWYTGSAFHQIPQSYLWRDVSWSSGNPIKTSKALACNRSSHKWSEITTLWFTNIKQLCLEAQMHSEMGTVQGVGNWKFQWRECIGKKNLMKIKILC